MTNTKDIGVIVVLLFVIGFIAVDFSGKVSSSVVENTDVSEPYSLEGLATEYEDRLALDENDKDALFSLARIYYIGNQTEKSLTAIAQYKERYPEEKRIYYISGLANAYGGNLRVAELEFLEFIDSGLSRWPGYLDLAWVYFQQGEFDQSQEKLDIALENFGSNMWLNTSRGAVALAQGENEESLRYLYRAQEQAKTVTVEEWRENYSLNDPAEFENEIDRMRAVIETNITYAQGGQTPSNIAEVLNATFASASPLGVSKGLAVSACGGSNVITSCVSAANICGQVNTGTQNSGTGNVCSATVPANPSGQISIPTACGVDAVGFLGCNGQYNITNYPFCTTTENPKGDGEVTWVTITDNSGNGIGVSGIFSDIFAVPALVSSGNSTVIRWLSTETASCTVTSTNGDTWSGTIGEEVTTAITGETTYTVTCEGYDQSSISDSVIVDIVPNWEEF